jgi:hypothetical protein
LQDISKPGCTVGKEGDMAIMECRNYCMEEGCNKGGRVKMSFIVIFLLVVSVFQFE